ncbi:MAG: acyl-CoA dehydrogenase [Gammaproteobacteria bacterium]|nr:MAG: acyl-CoA dehydrogenase [Gammaproteobacteria bacterium]
MLNDRKVYDSEHAIFREGVRRFFNAEMMRYRDEWDRAGTSPRDFWRKCGEAGFLCPQVPEEYGGAGADFRYNCIVAEETFYGGPAINLGVHSDIVTPYLLHYGTPDQKRRWLPGMVSGEIVTAIAMTEPGTGSDLANIKTSARLESDQYVIDGQKTFISNGQNADLILVVAKTDPAARAKGVSLIFVESSREGFARGQNLDKMGQHAADTSELFFDNVCVPVENRIGEENQGFKYLMQELPQERLIIAVTAAAAAQHAFDITLPYVRERQAFGRAIADFQNTRFKLAEMATELKVGWAFLDQCIATHLQGELSSSEASMAKLWLTEMLGRVVDQCVQLHGGYGYVNEYGICKAYVDARAHRIYGGTSEIMKELISRSL